MGVGEVARVGLHTSKIDVRVGGGKIFGRVASVSLRSCERRERVNSGTHSATRPELTSECIQERNQQTRYSMNTGVNNQYWQMRHS